MSRPGAGRLAAAYRRALADEKAGRREAAIAGWRRVLALDPADHGGAAIRLAALGAAAAPEAAPAAYVRTLFDQHAEVFDDVLVARLGYGVPAAMRRLLEGTTPGTWARLLDLGCGTGLVGAALAGLAAHSTGVDLSEGMLALADARGAYDALYVGDATGFLAAEAGDGEPAAWDLVAAADVLPYLGALEALFVAVAGRCEPGGVWLFSTETLPDAVLAGRDFMVGPNQRFAHARPYVEAALGGSGFRCESVEPIVVRHEQGAPVPGHLVLARRD